MSARPRCFDQPVQVRLDAFELPGTALAVARHQGSHSACDVWLSFTSTDQIATLGPSIWTLNAINGTAEVEVDRARVYARPFTTIGNIRSLILLQARSVPCDGFVARLISPVPTLGTVNVLMECFGDGYGPSRVGALEDPATSVTALTAIVTGALATAIASNDASQAKTVVVHAPSTNSAEVFIGGSGVTLLTGLPLAPGDSFTMAVEDAGAIYAISAAAQAVRIVVLA